LEVIHALKALPATQRASLEYWLVGAHGKENYDKLLAAAAADAGFPVKFIGDIPDDQLGATYAQADIFAMTSMPHRHSVEGFGLVYLEAGAHGLPIVAHAIGGVPEAVVDGVTGLLVAPGDTPALTRPLPGCSSISRSAAGSARRPAPVPSAAPGVIQLWPCLGNPTPPPLARSHD